MNERRPRALMLVPVILAVLLGSHSSVAADELELELVFASISTIVEVGRTRMIPLRAGAPDRDRSIATTVDDISVVQVIQAVLVPEGRTVGFARVRGLKSGTTVLRAGGTSIRLNVVEPRVAISSPPRIVGPSNGAAIWGVISVGVEIVSPHTSGQDTGPITLHSSRGQSYDPVADSGASMHPHRHVRFEIDAGRLAPGPVSLTPVLDGLHGAPVTVRVVHPDAEDITAGEAEASYDVERPDRFPAGQRHVGRHRDASGGLYFSNASAQPALCFPVDIERAGWYQLVLAAGGTRAQGVLPTVGVVIDGANQSTTNGRLLSDEFHRAAIGIPFRLEPGTHIVTPLFANDFYVPRRADRNLMIDRIEVARIDDDDVADERDALAAEVMTRMSMSSVASMAVSAEESSDLFARDLGSVRIGLTRVLDGETAPGLLEVDSRLAWSVMESAPPPKTTLYVNDEPIVTQRSGAPRFWIDPGHWRAGDNAIRLVVSGERGTIAATPTQTVHYPEECMEGVAPPRDIRRFSIHEDAWDGALRERLRAEHNPSERRAAAFSSNGRARLTLPKEMHGEYDVYLELRGDTFRGPAQATVRLVGTGTSEVGVIDAPNWWDTRLAGTVTLDAAARSLEIAFENDEYEEGVGDRNLWFQAVIFAEKRAGADTTPPWVEIAWPDDDTVVYGVDAVVASGSDNASLASAELLIDGGYTGQQVPLNLKPGRIVMPLLLTDLDPGPHVIEIVVTDTAGNTVRSEPRRVVVSADPPQAPGPYVRAVRLLDRFAFGPDERELAAILELGEDAWLRTRLAAEANEDLTALGAYVPHFRNRGDYEVAGRAAAHLLMTTNPVRARFVMWAQNHFSTWLRKAGGLRKWDEYVAFTEIGVAPFGDLLFTSVRSPAMLGYLDQDASFAGRINENLAREMLELHTLGVDGPYDQDDVTSFANVLTGWTAAFQGDGVGGGPQAAQYDWRFDPALSDGSARRVLGMPLPNASPVDRYDRICSVIEMLAAHPGTATFVCTQLVQHYVGTPAPDGLVEDLAAVFLDTNGDLAEVLIAMASHDSFHTAPLRLSHPIDYATRLFRTCGHMQPWRFMQYLNSAGHGMFDRSTPDGYPDEDFEYTDSNAMIQRWRLARDTMWPIVSAIPGRWTWDRELSDDDFARRAIELVAARLTGRVLSDQSMDAALEVFRATEGDRGTRMRTVGPFIAQLPEANLR